MPHQYPQDSRRLRMKQVQTLTSLSRNRIIKNIPEKGSQIQESKSRSGPDTSEQFNLFKKGIYMTLSNFIRLPTRLLRTNESPIEMGKSTRSGTNKVIVNLPIPRSEVELHPTLAYVLKLITASKCQGIRRPPRLSVGLSRSNWNLCIRSLRAKGALIDATMKEGRTRQGHMSTRIIHYIYRGWK